MVNLLGAGLILAFFWLGLLNAGALFGIQYAMMGGIIIGCLLIMRRSWTHIDWGLSRDQRLAYTREFSDYSMPLFVQALLSALALSAERWVLQWFDGSTQQGYFALSQRVSAACFLFVSAMTPLIMRELAIAWGKDDREHMGRLLTRFAPLLFGIAAWFSCFTAVEASVLVHIFGGAEFAAALIPAGRSWCSTPRIRPTDSLQARSFTPRAAPKPCAISPLWNISAVSSSSGCWSPRKASLGWASARPGLPSKP